MPVRKEILTNPLQIQTLNQAKIFSLLQDEFPLHPYPFRILSEKLETSEAALLQHIHDLEKKEKIRRIGAIVNLQALGSRESTLIAGKIPPSRLKNVARIINEYPQVSHNYRRDHNYNLWFTLAEKSICNLEKIFVEIQERSKINTFVSLPAVRRFKLNVRFQFTSNKKPQNPTGRVAKNSFPRLTELDGKLIEKLYLGVPLQSTPFRTVAEELKISESKLIERIKKLKKVGVIKRFGASFNHRKIGVKANGMSVWKVPSTNVQDVAKELMHYEEISHVYERKTIPGKWEYNLFGMIHAKTPRECNEIAQEISQKTGNMDYKLLYSIEEYKKSRPPLFLDAILWR